MNATTEGVVHVSEIPHGSVVITPSQMYDLMQSTRDEVKHLTAIVDPALAEIRADVARNAERIETVTAERKTAVEKLHAADEKLDGRVRALENWRWLVMGAATALGALGGWSLSSILGG